jgi:hypothetical protein
MDAKLLGLKIVKNIAKTQTGEFKGGVIYFINEPHGVKLGDDAPTVVLGRTANSQCVYRIDDLASHNSHVPQWDAGVDGKDEAAMKTYIERITSDIEAKAAAYEYADPQQGVNLADANEVAEVTTPNTIGQPINLAEMWKSMTVAQLKAEAKAYGIKAYSTMTKAQLVEALKNA